MNYENLLVTYDGPVATITLNRPERLNALSNGLLRELEAALREINPGDEIRVVRLRGAGRAFCPGYDLQDDDSEVTVAYTPTIRRGDAMADLGESSIARDREFIRQSVERWLWIWNFRKPIIAQTHAFCLSGGLDLIGTTDLVFAAEGTLFGHPAARGMGIPFTLGMLPAKIGAAATKELLFTGDLIDAEEAQRLGLVRRVLPPDDLDGWVLDFCQRVALQSLDVLTVHKHITNRWQELAGLRNAAFSGADYNAIAHMAPAAAEFARRVGEGGLRAALDWRDGPFASGPAADHDHRNRRAE